MSKATNSNVQLDLMVRDSVANSWRVIATPDIDTSGSSHIQHVYDVPIPLVVGCDMCWVVNSVSANNTGVSGTFDVMLKPDGVGR